MKTNVLSTVLMAGLAVGVGSACGLEPSGSTPAPAPASEPAPQPEDPAFILNRTMTDIDGKPVDLSTFKGKVLVIVNVASQCGLTPQYEALQDLYDAKKDSGLVVLGFPANNFGGQEPGTNEEIKAFCTGKFDVSFPMFSKISVKGEDADPLYKQIAGLPAPLGGEPRWNFTKFLVDRSGRVVARFEPRVTPSDPKFAAKVDELLKAQ